MRFAWLFQASGLDDLVELPNMLSTHPQKNKMSAPTRPLDELQMTQSNGWCHRCYVYIFYSLCPEPNTWLGIVFWQASVNHWVLPLGEPAHSDLHKSCHAAPAVMCGMLSERVQMYWGSVMILSQQSQWPVSSLKVLGFVTTWCCVVLLVTPTKQEKKLWGESEWCHGFTDRKKQREMRKKGPWLGTYFWALSCHVGPTLQAA